MVSPRRQNFTDHTIALRFAHCRGRCEGCGTILIGRESYEGDHDTPTAAGGNSSFENCRIMCLDCHSDKTLKDVRDLAKGARQAKRNAGIKPKGRGFQTNRDGGWKKPFYSNAIRRDT